MLYLGYYNSCLGCFVVDLASNDNVLYNEISALIEQNRRSVYSYARRSTILMFWEIGRRISNDILENKRADYGKQIVSMLSTQLVDNYGSSFAIRNLRRMMQFYEQFPDFEIVSMTSTQLSWSHFTEILPLKSMDAKLYYLNESARSVASVEKMRDMIKRKDFERKRIADTQISEESKIPYGTFKDPYLFDALGIKDEYLEGDIEEAVLRELEKFILEFGKGFAFLERQKRMVIDGKDFTLDLLFYNRYLKRLVAIDLKQVQFDAAFSGEMKLYLKWLNRYERQEGENEPIGLILCSTGNNREQIELLEMDKDGIMVAEYWTTLPPKDEFELKIQSIFTETRERIAQRKMLLSVPTENN